MECLWRGGAINRCTARRLLHTVTGFSFYHYASLLLPTLSSVEVFSGAKPHPAPVQEEDRLKGQVWFALRLNTLGPQLWSTRALGMCGAVPYHKCTEIKLDASNITKSFTLSNYPSVEPYQQPRQYHGNLPEWSRSCHHL